MEEQRKLIDEIEFGVPYDEIVQQLPYIDLNSTAYNSNLTPIMYLITLIQYYHKELDNKTLQNRKIYYIKLLDKLLQFELENPGKINVGASFNSVRNGKYVKENAFTLLIKYLINYKKNPSYLNPYSFQGVLYIFKYCMLYRIFETNCSVNLINAIVFLKKCLPTDPSVGKNKG